jgi:hypothetical protein
MDERQMVNQRTFAAALRGAAGVPLPAEPGPEPGRPGGWTELQWRTDHLRRALDGWDRAHTLDEARTLATHARALLRAIDDEAPK